MNVRLAPAMLRGDAGLLARLAGNLVENAVRHNVAGGSVWVATGRAGHCAVLEVANTGPRLDPAAVPGLVEPFRRAGPDRATHDGGVGLGLSIVEAIATAHGGNLILEARHEGGLRARVELPLAETPPGG